MHFDKFPNFFDINDQARGEHHERIDHRNRPRNGRLHLIGQVNSRHCVREKRAPKRLSLSLYIFIFNPVRALKKLYSCVVSIVRERCMSRDVAQSGNRVNQSATQNQHAMQIRKALQEPRQRENHAPLRIASASINLTFNSKFVIFFHGRMDVASLLPWWETSFLILQVQDFTNRIAVSDNVFELNRVIWGSVFFSSSSAELINRDAFPAFQILQGQIWGLVALLLYLLCVRCWALKFE